MFRETFKFILQTFTEQLACCTVECLCFLSLVFEPLYENIFD